MTTTTQQTPAGAVTTITMILANGASPPSVIHLPDSTSIKPAADGSITVASHWSDALMRAGWAFKYPGGASVPIV
jgi:hypothetical protein